MFRWLANLFRPLPDENAPKIREQFSFLIEDHGFSFATEDLGDAVDENGKFVFCGPLNAYYFYNEHVCINILYLEQRQDYEIYITDSHKSDQVYIRNGTRIEDQFAYHLDRYADAVKASIAERGEICGRKIQARYDRPRKSVEGDPMELTADRMPDVEVIFQFNGTRRTPVSDGYRPAHRITEDYLTTGVHHYFGVTEVAPNGTARGTITFITPEVYPHTLWPGKIIPIHEGERIVGTATVEKVLNQLLERE